MYLEGQGERGYAMAALLVSLGVMAVMMAAALPVWRHQAQREKESELLFRGDQYARAIYLWQRKNGPGSYPPNLDVLVQGKYLRKKYKDPITNQDFFLVRAGAPGAQPTVPGIQPPQGQQGRGQQPQIPGAQQPQFGAGGILTVQSTSKEQSIRVDRGTTYNQWRFLAPRILQPGMDPNNPGQQRPGQRGGPGQRGIGPGQRGNPPGRGGFPFGPGGIGPGGREGGGRSVIGVPGPGRGGRGQ